MRCIECDAPAVALCPRCQVAQCGNHLTRSQQWSARSGALAGCRHPDRATPDLTTGAASR